MRCSVDETGAVMGDSVDLAVVVHLWLRDQKDRLAGHFQITQVNDWREWYDHGLALDLSSDNALGRITVWPKHMAEAEWPYADVEVISGRSMQRLHMESFVPFSTALLDKWFSILEKYSVEADINSALMLLVGKGFRPYPEVDENRVIQEYGLEQGAMFVARANEILEALDSNPGGRSKYSLAATSTLAVEQLRLRYPEIDDHGARALEWICSWWWK